MRWFWLGLLVVLTSLLGCRKPEGTSQHPDLTQRKARVVATTTLIADAVREIAGDAIEIETLMGPGIDPHNYNPTPEDLLKLQRADLILYNGLHLEGQMDEVFEQMGRRIRTRAVTAKLDPITDLRHADESIQSAHDPHVWFDVQLWMKVVQFIRDELIDLDPLREMIYRERSEDYLKRLGELHVEVSKRLEKVPKERKILITCHDAFGYFGRAYGFEVRGLQGISTESQVSISERNELARVIVMHRIPVIFGETSVPDRGIRALQETVRKMNFEVRLSRQSLYSDALGEPGTPTGTYLGMIQHNVAIIVEALAE